MSKDNQSAKDKVKINNIERKFEATEVNIIKGKIVSIIKKNEKGEEFIVDDPKIVIGKRKGFLAAIGLIKKEKFIGIINEKGDFIKDKNKINKVMSKIKGHKFEDLKENFIGTFDAKGKLPKNLKFEIDQNIVVNKDNKLLAIQQKDGLVNQYGTLLYTDELVEKNNKFYLISDSGADINTQKGVENLQNQPVKSALKSSKEESKKIKFNEQNEVREFDKDHTPNTQKGVENLSKSARSAMKGAREVAREATRIGENLKETLLKTKQADQNVASEIAGNARRAKKGAKIN